MTRRHRIHESELEPVFELITNELIMICNENLRCLAARTKHQHLFRLWWRIKEGRDGRPDYPDPITYGTIREHVVPRSWSNGYISPRVSPSGHPQPASSFPNPSVVAGGKHQEV